MSIKPFGSVKTITLPVPNSDLTASEYKEAYGIDLESINLYDLILLKKDEISVPVLAIDRENKVLYTADSAYSYDGGFELQEGVSLVSEVIKTGTIENAKPIYCHPITSFNQSGDVYYMFTALIFNNSPTAFTKATFKNFIDSLPASSSIMASGYYKTTDKEITSISYLGKAGNNYIFDGGVYNTSGFVRVSFDWNDVIGLNTSVFIDGVNKIN